MNNTYQNLNTVTLYNTVQFNKTDTTIFATLNARDNYFNSLEDKLVIDDFTDLYENRQFSLPYNYLDVKKYNTMKLHYDDGLGHITDYYCNVDSYSYVSTDVCTPIYRIDYFLTYGYLLYNKNIDIITNRRTVAEDEITKYMKADEMSVPKLNYTEVSTSSYSGGHCFIILLNKTTDNIGKKGITTNMYLDLGTDSSGNIVTKLIDSYTIGTYILVCKPENLSTRLSYESNDYIEKIIECDIEPNESLTEPDINSYNTNGYVYVTSDINKRCDVAFNTNFSNGTKKILNRLPYKGIVAQGNEFDPNDFDIEDRPKNDNVTTYYEYLELLIFNNFGTTFIYPVGYKGDSIGYEYMVQWQSGRNFSYTSDYTNSLAYKELLESNNQAIKYTEQNSNLNIYYNNKLNSNNNQQLDISKKQTSLSYQSQVNSLNTDINNTQIKKAGGLFGSVLSAIEMASTGNYIGAIKCLFGYGTEVATTSNNLSMLNYQVNNLNKQKNLELDLKDLQKDANNINNNFQCDTIALARDNTISNISISNKYNNAKPNAYNQTDYTKYTSKFYLITIDDRKGLDNTQYKNLCNHYNVEGISVNYLENLNLSNYHGLYFDYIKGSIIDNSNKLSNSMPYDIYIQLVQRIENGVRIWHNLNWFGNLTIDNTATTTPEPYTILTENEKRELQDYVNVAKFNGTKAQINEFINTEEDYTDDDKNYSLWYNDNLNWGTQFLTPEKENEIESLADLLLQTNTKIKTIDIFRSNNTMTIYEIQYAEYYIEHL